MEQSRPILSFDNDKLQDIDIDFYKHTMKKGKLMKLLLCQGKVLWGVGKDENF